MKINHYWKLLTKKIKVIKPASFFSIANIKAVGQSYIRSIGGFNIDQHIYEQIIWRRTEVIKNSPECWEKGYCKVCGCEILGRTMEDRACAISEVKEMLDEGDIPCFPKMMKFKEWELYKKHLGIKIFE